MYEDKTLICKDCGSEFIFTAGEQEFYAEQGFENEPKRCKACRDARKAVDYKRQMFTTVCDACSETATVPFEPSGDRPVYCSACFEEINNAKVNGEDVDEVIARIKQRAEQKRLQQELMSQQLEPQSMTANISNVPVTAGREI
ncbi:MAG: zinc-ribbon domain containing protein [Clostridia bacterium]|nr:zinc-ribbon domain containing protein [Clostridia bacterium]